MNEPQPHEYSEVVVCRRRHGGKLAGTYPVYAKVRVPGGPRRRGVTYYVAEFAGDQQQARVVALRAAAALARGEMPEARSTGGTSTHVQAGHTTSEG